MATPTNRDEFKSYVLRKIGAGVIEINVSDEQVDDRIDEALNFFTDFHYNGSEHVYLKHLLTETDVANGYVECPDNLIAVTSIFDIGFSVSMGGDIWGVQYQYILNNMSELTSSNISNYWMTMQNIAFVQEWLVGKPLIRYNRHANRLYIDDSGTVAGQWIIISCYAALDGDEFNRIWSDRWLQNYAAVLVKEQWGTNLGKFQNVQLMGGISFNGDQIMQQAREDRNAMEQEAYQGLNPLGNIGFTG